VLIASVWSWVILLVGLVVGAALGLLAAGLCQAAARGDEAMLREAERRRQALGRCVR
jgi:uncharacterized membrane-anchored protein YhcB (DUF1043 family)